MNSYKNKSAVTLIELSVAIFLLSTIVLAGITIELAMRRMQVKPRAESKLRNELIPVIEMIRKDFEYGAVGTIFDPGIVSESAASFRIKVGSVYSSNWHRYEWNTTGQSAYQFWYYPQALVDESVHTVIAYGITNFAYSIGNSNTSLNIMLETRSDPTKPSNPITNPSVTLNTTIYSRSISAL